MKPTALPTLLCLGLLVLPATAVPAAAQMRVKVAAVVAAPLRQTLQLPGNLVSPRSSALTPQVEGHVAELLVEAGDRVEAGQPLLRLDDTVARLELERLTHSLREAEHLHRDARRLAREAETLAGTQSVSRSKSQTQIAQAAIEEARVSQLRAAVAIQGERLRHHTLAAPFAGTVTGRQTERGQWVGTSAAVLRLTGTDPLRVDVEVPERHFGRIAPGTPVTILAAEGADGDRDGTGGIAASVARVVPAADPVSRSFLVHIGLPNPTGSLMPGMSARVVFALDHGRDDVALQVPADAVVRKADGGARVWVVRAGGDGAPATARPVEVRTGRHAGGWVEIAAPEGGVALRPDDLVVVQGNEGLRPGQPVVPETLG